MNIEEQKRQREALKFMKMQNARTLGEQYPEVEYVEVEACLSFESGVGVFEEKSVERIFRPSDLLYLHFDCLNKDCTGYGFEVTTEIRNAIVNRETVELHWDCSGKEDWKYVQKATSCSCQGRLDCVIRPHFA